MAIVYPENHKKYIGSVKNLADGRFMSQVAIGEGKTSSKVFDTREDAESDKMQRCTELGLVKNILIDCGDYYEMELTQGYKTKIDKKSFDKVDEKVWHAAKRRDRWYVCAHIKGSDDVIYLHNYLMNFTPNGNNVIDHINRDSLDNRLTNLRIVDITTNNINQGMRKDNESGIKGVHYDVRKNAWLIQWCENKTRKSRTFSVKKYGYDNAKQLAINARKLVEAADPVYANALGN